MYIPIQATNAPKPPTATDGIPPVDGNFDISFNSTLAFSNSAKALSTNSWLTFTSANISFVLFTTAKYSLQLSCVYLPSSNLATLLIKYSNSDLLTVLISSLSLSLSLSTFLTNPDIASTNL